MEQQEQRTEHAFSSPIPEPGDAFNTAPLPAAEHQTQNREKLQLQWGDLLQAAVRDPGLLLDAYSRFHGYSLGNRLAALVQCHARGLEPGPIHTYQGWRQLGYQVKSGEKALWLCMPLTRKVSGDGTPQGETAEKSLRNGKNHKAGKPENGSQAKPDGADAKIEVISAFLWKPHWFVLSQTDPIPGQEAQPIENPPLGVWHKAKALQTLGITEIPFDLMDGNCQGYAKERSVAVSPLAALPYKTLFHEMAHVVLGHTQQKESGILLIDGDELPTPQPRHICEAEAEATALILLATLDLPGQEYCRGYIQSWLKGGEGIGEASARRIFGAADKMLRAGLNANEGDEFPQEAPVPAPLPPPVRTEGAELSAPAVQFEQMPTAPLAARPTPTRMPWRPEANGHGTNGHGTAHRLTGLIPSQHPHPQIEFSAATLPRPPTVEARGAFSFDGEMDLFQLLMGLHESGSDLNPLNGLHPDVKRALTYLQAKDPPQAPALLYWLHTAALALDAAAQIANQAICWPVVEGFYNPQALAAPTPPLAPSEATAALNGGFEDTPQAWLTRAESATPTAASQTTEKPDQESEHANGASLNGTAAMNGKPSDGPSSARAEASARRTLGRAFRSELERERRRFFAIAEKQSLPTGRESAKAIRDAISQLLEIPVKTRADLTARQWGLAGSAIETGDLSW